MMTQKEIDELPVMLTVKEVAEILRIGKAAAYELMYQKNFPVLKLGERKIRVPKDGLIEWIQNNTSYYQIG